jgi:protease PrsW
MNGPYGQGPSSYGTPPPGPQTQFEPPANPNMPSPYRTRRIVGGTLWLAGQAVGGLLFLLLFIILPLFEENPANAFIAMALGALIAFPAMVVYLTFPRLLDRYDPEPLWALLLCLFWGALAACGFAGFINTAIGAVFTNIAGPEVGEGISIVVSAPICEELFKGIMVVGVFYFLRDQFDGVVDGIIYATFTAIGFAATENVIYYARAMQDGGVDALGVTVLIRGFLAPWGHPLYTSMTGIGLGLARESENKVVRVLAPFVGYAAAVFLHATWNGTALIGGGVAFLCMLPLWMLFVAAFVVLVLVLVRRRGNIIRQHLLDEVALRNISQAELIWCARRSAA